MNLLTNKNIEISKERIYNSLCNLYFLDGYLLNRITNSFSGCSINSLKKNFSNTNESNLVFLNKTISSVNKDEYDDMYYMLDILYTKPDFKDKIYYNVISKEIVNLIFTDIDFFNIFKSKIDTNKHKLEDLLEDLIEKLKIGSLHFVLVKIIQSSINQNITLNAYLSLIEEHIKQLQKDKV